MSSPQPPGEQPRNLSPTVAPTSSAQPSSSQQRFFALERHISPRPPHCTSSRMLLRVDDKSLAEELVPHFQPIQLVAGT